MNKGSAASKILINKREKFWLRKILEFSESSGHFLGIVSLVFAKFWHGARNPYEVLRIFWEFFLLPKLGKYNKNGPKTVF